MKFAYVCSRHTADNCKGNNFRLSGQQFSFSVVRFLTDVRTFCLLQCVVGAILRPRFYCIFWSSRFRNGVLRSIGLSFVFGSHSLFLFLRPSVYVCVWRKIGTHRLLSEPIFVSETKMGFRDKVRVIHSFSSFFVLLLRRVFRFDDIVNEYIYPTLCCTYLNHYLLVFGKEKKRKNVFQFGRKEKRQIVRDDWLMMKGKKIKIIMKSMSS
jgi:hypothetical protein